MPINTSLQTIFIIPIIEKDEYNNLSSDARVSIALLSVGLTVVGW